MWGEDEIFDDRPEAAQTGSNGLPVASTPAAAQHQYAPPVIPPPGPRPPQQRHIPEPQYEDFVQEEVGSESAEDEDDSEVLSDANLRLEQGSLYKMIMKHELFDGVDADPKAVKNVQKAIRKFAREQMEAMLGMRQETTKIERLEIEFPFNALEVDILKKLAHTATKGATEHSDNYVPSVSKITEEFTKPKQNTLNAIGTSAPKPRPLAKTPKKPVPRPTAQAARSSMDTIIDNIAAQLADPQVSKETIKAGLRREFEEHNQLLNKPISELNAYELEERNKMVAQRRGNQVKSNQAIPMPSAEQQASMIETSVPKVNKLVELAMKMPASKLLESGE
jgi:hypothetical protein